MSGLISGEMGISYRGNNICKHMGMVMSNGFPVTGIVHKGKGALDGMYIWSQKAAGALTGGSQWGLQVRERSELHFL